MEELREILPVSFIIIIPLAMIQIGLMIAALVHIFRHKTYRIGNRVIWVVVCLLVNIIGPVLYFAIGKGDK